MCEVCHAEGKDYRYLNGTKTQITIDHLYKVFRDSVAPIKLCHIHSIELFMLGERRFLKEHLQFAYQLANKAQKSAATQSPFGF